MKPFSKWTEFIIHIYFNRKVATVDVLDKFFTLNSHSGKKKEKEPHLKC